MATRRAVLLGGASVLLAACSGSNTKSGTQTAPETSGSTTTSPPGTSPGTPSPSQSPTAQSPTTTQPPTTPPSALWTPNAGELEPDIKATAVTYVAAHTSAANLRVIDAQYGGLLDTSASVLVVTSNATYDVRLVQASPHWRVTAMYPSNPGAPAASISRTATALLRDPRVVLPPAAGADVRSGEVHDSVLEFLTALSAEHELDVSVMRSGHPLYVFGTNRPSDHPKGRAVDIFRIDGHAVVDPATPASLVDGVMRRAAALGAYNIGGPRQLSGPQFFSDRTHHDHVHVGFNH
jgi:hypothetical protein